MPRVVFFLVAGAIGLSVIFAVLFGVYSSCHCIQSAPNSFDAQVAKSAIVVGSLAIISAALLYSVYLYFVMLEHKFALPFTLFAVALLLMYHTLVCSSTLCACSPLSTPLTVLHDGNKTSLATESPVSSFRYPTAFFFATIGAAAVLQLIVAPTGRLVGCFYDITIATAYPLVSTSSLFLFFFTPALAKIESPELSWIPLALMMILILMGQVQSHGSPRPLHKWEVAVFFAPAQEQHYTQVVPQPRYPGEDDPESDHGTTAQGDDILIDYPSSNKKHIVPLLQPLSSPLLGEHAHRHSTPKSGAKSFPSARPSELTSLAAAAAAASSAANNIIAEGDAVWAETLARVRKIAITSGDKNDSVTLSRLISEMMPSIASSATSSSSSSSPAFDSSSQQQQQHRHQAQRNDTLTVAQITDPHLGSVMSEQRLSRICQSVVLLNPDLVFITGDMYTVETAREDGLLARALAPLKQIPAGRIFACVGNHDVLEGPSVYNEFLSGVASCGATILQDEHRIVQTRCGPVEIIGLRFYHNAGPSIRSYFLDIRAADVQTRRMHFRSCVARFVLLHDPAGFVHLPPKLGAVCFSGHVHGGQIAISAARHMTLGRMVGLFDNGLWQHKDQSVSTNLLYVHRGQGHRSLMSNAVPRMAVPSEDSVMRIRVRKGCE